MTGARLGARAWWGLVPLLVLLWGTGALLSTALPGLPSTPVVTVLTLPIVGFARDIALSISVGAIAVLLLTPAPRLRGWAVGWGLVGAGLAAGSAVALRADLAASGLGEAANGSDLVDLVNQTYAGRAVVIQVIGVLLAVLLVAVARGPRLRVVALVIGLVGVAAPAMAGHAGISGPHAAAGVAVALHVAGVSLWLGGLAAVCGLLLLEGERAPVLLPRFSLMALICVIVVAEAGLMTASLNLPSLADLVGSTYGSLILGKAALLAMLIRLGWRQRREALDLLPDASVPSIMARLAGVELTLLGTAVAASVVLARIGTPALPSTGFAPLALVALAIGAPIVTVLSWPRGWRVTDGLPEVAVIVLLIVLVEVGGVGVLRHLWGGLGLVLEIALLVLAGWLAVSSLRLPSARVATGIALIGIPLALAAIVRLGDDVPVRMAVVSAVAADAVLLVWLLRVQRPADRPAAVPVAG